MGLQGKISIHSPRVRGDTRTRLPPSWPSNFYPLPSGEGRHGSTVGAAEGIGISIHSPRVRGDSMIIRDQRGAIISIHSPRVRGDQAQFFHHKKTMISIHSPRVRGDHFDFLHFQIC